MSKVSRGIVAVGVLGALALGLMPATAASGRTLDHEALCSTDHDFTREIDNRYLPMPQVDEGDPEVVLGVFAGDGEALTITVLPGSNTVDGVETNIVEEFEWVNDDGDGDWEPERGEAVVEISLNYFAQTEDGTVCYFGEDVDIWDPPTVEPEKDKPESHDGAWLAGDDGAVQGVIMPAAPRKGDVYMQEDAPEAEARDQAVITGFGTVEVGDFRYRKAMRTSECNLAEGPADCDDPSLKVYAPGVGLVADGDLVLIKAD